MQHLGRRVAPDHRKLYPRSRRAQISSAKIGSVLRNAAVRIAEGSATRIEIGENDLVASLGSPRFESEVAERVRPARVATGLAWTPVGGDILFIEASAVPARVG